MNIKVKKLIDRKHVGKNGLLKENNKTIYDDTWFHNNTEDEEKSIIRFVNKSCRTIKKSLIIGTDLSKSGMRKLHKERLIQKPVQVRGKDGKVHTRMQWVNPNKDMTDNDMKSSQQEEPNTPVSKPKESLDADILTHDHDIREASKIKVYDKDTQEGYIDFTLDNMGKDEKKKLIEKHSISWKRNDYPAIDWKNAVMALKVYMKEHPDLLGANHLPKESMAEKTLEGTDKVNDFCNHLSDEQKYDLMKKIGICEEDPRLNPAWTSKKKGGDGTGFIKHMKNMMQLKNYLKDNPNVMTSPSCKPDPIGGSKPTSKSKSPAQKGGNTIEGILKSLSDEQKYDLMREHGISQQDPRLNPAWTSKKKGGDGTGFIKHMKNMMQLKKLIQDNPQILTTSYGKINEDERNRLKNMNTDQKVVDGIKNMVGSMSKDLKVSVISQLEKQGVPEIVNRDRSDNENIDYMRAVIAFRKYLENNPDKVNDYQDVLKKEQLSNYHINNKELEYILRNVVGLSGTQIDYAKVVEKDKEWSFGISSFARIDEEKGEPILSIVDCGYDGTDWNEYVYPMTDIKSYVDKLRNKEKVKNDSNKPQALYKPLHQRGLIEIEKELNKDFKGNWSKEVSDAIQTQICGYWTSALGSNRVSAMIDNSLHLNKDSMYSVLEEWNVPVDRETGTFDCDSREWKSIYYKDLISLRKQGKNANDFIVKRMPKDPKSLNPCTQYDAFPLIESAKNWTERSRTMARKDLLSDRTTFTADTPKEIQRAVISHIEEGTSFIPFDLFSEFSASGIKYHFDAEGRSNFYSPKDHSVHFSKGYLNEDTTKVASAFSFSPDGSHPFSDVISHETAHAIARYFSGLSRHEFAWNNSIARKYGITNPNVVPDSYNSCVKRSNPNREVIKVDYETTKGTMSYYIHKDEWMNSYEGRIYNTNDSEFISSKSGALVDTISQREIGSEHWSENVSRFSQAHLAFKQYLRSNPDKRGTVTIDEWAKGASKRYMDKGLGDDWTTETGETMGSYTTGKTEARTFSNRDNHPVETYGYLYHNMKSRYPELSETINKIFNRTDFIYTENKVEKSEKLIILHGEE